MLPSPPRPAAGSLPGGDMTFARRRSSGTTSGWTDDHACHQPSGIRGEAGTMLSPAEPCPPAGRPGRAPAGPRPSAVGPGRTSTGASEHRRAKPNIGGHAARQTGRPEHRRVTPHASRPRRESAGASAGHAARQQATPGVGRSISGPRRTPNGASPNICRPRRTPAGRAGSRPEHPSTSGRAEHRQATPDANGPSRESAGRTRCRPDRVRVCGAEAVNSAFGSAPS
jgi:hypothetical protein